LYVVDTSVYVPLMVILKGKMRKVMLKHKFHILDLTLYEACNAFWKECTKLHKINEEMALRSCELAVKLSRYAFVHKLEEVGVKEVMGIALSEDITVYDASYIALAKKLKAPIASEDKDILRVAPKYGIEVYDLESFVKLLSQNLNA